MVSVDHAASALLERASGSAPAAPMAHSRMRGGLLRIGGTALCFTFGVVASRAIVPRATTELNAQLHLFFHSAKKTFEIN